MTTNFFEELTWRRMLCESMPGTDKLLNTEKVRGYIGFDPTASSLGVGNLVQVMTLLHFQQAGHTPFVLVGGATGMVGDPSGKSDERNLLSVDQLQANLAGQRAQLERLLDFSPSTSNRAQLVNNYDWFQNVRFLDFIRETGKHITVNYMMAKDSVKKRISGEDREGMSFTEFTYQLIQGYDFFHLWKNHGVKLQMGGSDQWGNITTGTELIRRMARGEDAFGLITNLITKADGTKFGKTESGNLWLDPARTSPYEFYQFWLNASDVDVKSYIRIFTLLDRATIEGLEKDHDAAPQNRVLQKTLAKDITTRVHGKDELDFALAATDLLFGKGTIEQLKALPADRFASIFAGVPQAEVTREAITAGINVVDLFAKLVESKSQVHRELKANSLSLNKEKVGSDAKLTIGADKLINGRYLLLQKGKKDYCLVQVVG